MSRSKYTKRSCANCLYNKYRPENVCPWCTHNDKNRRIRDYWKKGDQQ